MYGTIVVWRVVDFQHNKIQNSDFPMFQVPFFSNYTIHQIHTLAPFSQYSISDEEATQAGIQISIVNDNLMLRRHTPRLACTWDHRGTLDTFLSNL